MTIKKIKGTFEDQKALERVGISLLEAEAQGKTVQEVVKEQFAESKQKLQRRGRESQVGKWIIQKNLSQLEGLIEHTISTQGRKCLILRNFLNASMLTVPQFACFLLQVSVNMAIKSGENRVIIQHLAKELEFHFESVCKETYLEKLLKITGKESRMKDSTYVKKRYLKAYRENILKKISAEDMLREKRVDKANRLRKKFFTKIRPQLNELDVANMLDLFDLVFRGDDKNAIKKFMSHAIPLLVQCGVFVENVKKTKIKGEWKGTRWLELHPSIAKIAEKNFDALAGAKHFKPPMVIPPYNWENPFNGGYIKGDDCGIIRGVRDKSWLWEQHEAGNFDMTYKLLNAVQSVPYEINDKVLEAIHWFRLTRCTETDDFMKLPRTTQLDRETFVNNAIQCNKYIEKDEDGRVKAEDWKAYNEVYLNAHKDKTSINSKNWVINRQLECAEQFKVYKELFFPANCDYRGRIYFQSVFLNPQGDHVAKGLLQFAVAKKLGQNGLKALYLNTANSYGCGLDKKKKSERIQWVLDNLDEILRIGDLSTEGYKQSELLFKSDEKPFSFLACCFEIFEAHQLPNPANYKSKQICWSDGSCNGIQVLSAMNRSTEGKLVNLTKNESGLPNDIYMDVANEAQKIIKDVVLKKIDIAEFIPKNTPDERLEEVKKARYTMALSWVKEGAIDRKLCKQPTMTLPYGSGFEGCTKQIMNVLKAKKNNVVDVDKRLGRTADPLSNLELSEHCRFISTVVSKARENVLTNCLMLQGLMKELCDNLSSKNEGLAYNVPMTRFPVVQKTLREKVEQVTTSLGKVNLYKNDVEKGVHPVKQKNKISPNITHSFDSAHLVLTGLACTELGMSFSCVHDSFGVHASDYQLMNQVLREQFVLFFEADPLKDVFLQQLGVLDESEIPPIPAGELDLKEVLSSPYFFH